VPRIADIRFAAEAIQRRKTRREGEERRRGEEEGRVEAPRDFLASTKDTARYRDTRDPVGDAVHKRLAFNQELSCARASIKAP
jgi:hypothetical protein